MMPKKTAAAAAATSRSDRSTPTTSLRPGRGIDRARDGIASELPPREEGTAVRQLPYFHAIVPPPRSRGLDLPQSRRVRVGTRRGIAPRGIVARFRRIATPAVLRSTPAAPRRARREGDGRLRDHERGRCGQDEGGHGDDTERHVGDERRRRWTPPDADGRGGWWRWIFLFRLLLRHRLRQQQENLRTSSRWHGERDRNTLRGGLPAVIAGNLD